MAAPSPSPAPVEDAAAPAAVDVDLPRAAVRKVVKARLAALAPAPADDGTAPKEPGLTKDAVAALAESAKVCVWWRGEEKEGEDGLQLARAVFNATPPPPFFPRSSSPSSRPPPTTSAARPSAR